MLLEAAIKSRYDIAHYLIKEGVDIDKKPKHRARDFRTILKSRKDFSNPAGEQYQWLEKVEELLRQKDIK